MGNQWGSTALANAARRGDGLSDREIAALGRAGQAKRGIGVGPKAGSENDVIEVVFDTVAYTPGGMGGPPDLDTIVQSAIDIVFGGAQISLGLSAIGLSGITGVGSLGSASPGAIVLAVAGGGLIANGYGRAAIGVSNMVLGVSGNRAVDVPKSAAELAGVAADGVIYGITNDRGDTFQNVGRVLGGMPVTAAEMFFNPAPLY